MWLLTILIAIAAVSCNNNITTITTLQPIQNNTTGFYNELECLDRPATLTDDYLTCECHAVDHNNNSQQVEVECQNGVPLIDTLPPQTNRLIIHGIDQDQMTSLFNELENSTLNNNLNYLMITNSTIAGSNVTWSNLNKIKILNISNNDITEFCDTSIVLEKTIIDKTIINELTILDLSKNLINKITIKTFRTFKNLIKLYLRDNIIDNIDENSFINLVKLENLDISDNKLRNLPDCTLTNLSSLQILNLSGNQLTFLGARWFEKLGKLRELDVSRNGLTKAASDALQPLPGLSVLRLAENPLMERDVSLLLGTGRRLETVDASRTGLLRVPAALTRSVRALRLAGNKLTCIRDGDFDGYPLLKILDLSDNKLRNIEDDSLGRLEVLEELDLSGNKLKIIPQSLPNCLLTLNLRGNIIDTLTIDDFQDIENIQVLILDDNLIEIIDEGTFSQALHLTKLDISNNPIKQLPANSLGGPVSLTNLRMSGLTSLEWEHEQHGDMAFPLPTPERLVQLDISYSPALAAQFLIDNAALSACKSLVELNLIATNITNLRFDLPYLLPQLKILGLSENNWNCSFNLFWLGEWIRLNEEIQPPGICSDGNVEFNNNNTLLVDLPAPPTTTTTMSSSSSNSKKSDQVSSYFNIIVPNTSSSTINNTTNVKNNNDDYWTTGKSIISKEIENATAIDEIPTTEIQLKLVNRSSKLNMDRVNGISMTLNTKYSRVYDTRQQQQIKHATSSVNKTSLNHDNKNGTRKKEKLLNIQKIDKSNKRKTLENRIDLKKKYTDKIDVKKKRKNIINIMDEKLSVDNNKIIDDDNSWVSDESDDKTRNRIELNDENIKNIPDNFILANAITNTIAQELNGRDVENNSRMSIAIPEINSHPGIMILIGGIIGAAAALTVVLSRRATLRNRDRYHRHENIEVHTLTPTIDLW